MFVDVPMPTRWLESIWNPDHYVPTRPLAIWTPLLPFEESPAMSYVHFLEDSNAPSMFFQLGIYIGNVRGSKVGVCIWVRVARGGMPRLQFCSKLDGGSRGT